MIGGYVILSRGRECALNVDQKLVNYLEEKQIKCFTLETGEAIALYKEL